MDDVNFPSHYRKGKIECIEAIEAALTKEEFIGYRKGAIMKYTWRAKHKGKESEDYKKLHWYATRLAKLRIKDD